MQEKRRKEKVLKNIIAQIIGTIVQTSLGFVVRRVFLDCLSVELLGINSLMSSIVGMLSIAELGVGEAINFSLYEPLAKGDKKQVGAIMRLYKLVYVIIAFVILLLGVFFLPALPYVVNSTIPQKEVYTIYMLFLLDTFLSYCLAYSRNIISADQKDYVVINIDTVSQILVSVFQIILLILTKNFILYILIKIAITLIRNIYIHRLSWNMYPFLKEKKQGTLSKEYKEKLLENIKALFVIKIAVFCVSGTDNLLLSSFVSITSVAIYANYQTLFNLINKTFNAIFDKARASIGNYLVTNTEEEAMTLFNNIFFANFLLTSFTAIGMFVLGNEVITIWLGEGMTWSVGIVAMISFCNYSRYIMQTCEAFRGAKGLYSPRPFVKYLSLFEGILNLIASVFFIKVFKMGVAGVFMGTMVSTLVSTISVPWIVYKFVFQKPLFEFWKSYLKYTGSAVLVAVLSELIFRSFYMENHWLNLIMGCIVCCLITGVCYWVIYRKTPEYNYYFDLLKNIRNKVNAP